LRSYEFCKSACGHDENREGIDSKDYLDVAIKAILDESMERIFRYLDLLYPHEVIEVIYERIREHPDSDVTRAHAI